MSITKKELFKLCDENHDAINELRLQSDSTDFVLATLIQQLKDGGIISELGAEPQPQLKQLDQSIFNGLDEKWRFAMVSSVGIPFVYDYKPTGKRHFLSDSSAQLMVNLGKVMRIDEYDYDTSNWQNSLIERDTAKELLEVDLSSELTGSDLARAMLERGDKYVMCLVFDDTRNLDVTYVIRGYHDGYFHTKLNSWENAIPINNQGEPLTAAEAGL